MDKGDIKMTVTKIDMIKMLAVKWDIPVTKAKKYFQDSIDIVARSLKDGQTVTMRGFGTFVIKTRKAGKGRNPITGESVEYSEKTKVRFVSHIKGL